MFFDVFDFFWVFLVFLAGRTCCQKFCFFGCLGFFFWFFGFLVEQHLTAKRWEGFGTAPEAKRWEGRRGTGGGVLYIYICIYIYIYVYNLPTECQSQASFEMLATFQDATGLWLGLALYTAHVQFTMPSASPMRT